MVVYLIAASAASEGAKPIFPPFDTWHFPSQIFWTVILFSVMYFALSRFILPKLGSVIEVRENKLADDLDEAALLSQQADEAQKALEVRMAEARAKARETADAARAKIDTQIAAETAKVDLELSRKLDEAEARISALREEAMKAVDAIAVDAARALTDRFDVSTSAAEAKSAVAKALGQ